MTRAGVWCFVVGYPCWKKPGELPMFVLFACLWIQWRRKKDSEVYLTPFLFSNLFLTTISPSISFLIWMPIFHRFLFIENNMNSKMFLSSCVLSYLFSPSNGFVMLIKSTFKIASLSFLNMVRNKMNCDSVRYAYIL